MSKPRRVEWSRLPDLPIYLAVERHSVMLRQGRPISRALFWTKRVQAGVSGPDSLIWLSTWLWNDTLCYAAVSHTSPPALALARPVGPGRRACASRCVLNHEWKQKIAHRPTSTILFVSPKTSRGFHCILIVHLVSASGDGGEINCADGKPVQSESVNCTSRKTSSVSGEDLTPTPNATTQSLRGTCSVEELTSPKAVSMERNDENSLTSSLTPSRLNPEVQEFVPRLCTKRPRPSDDAPTDQMESEKLQNSQSLPPKPLLIRKSTRDMDTQTEESQCAACRRQKLAQDDGGQNSVIAGSAILRSVSRDHKIKYVSSQAAMMVRENPESLNQDLELRARLKSKLQAMCHQFGSSLTDKSEVEDATICRIAVDLLKEQPIFYQEDKRVSFLRHLSAEADVQLEIAYELMIESPVKEAGEKTCQDKDTKNQEQSVKKLTAVASSPATQSDLSSTTNVDSSLGIPSQDYPSNEHTFPETNSADGSNNALLVSGQGKVGGITASQNPRVENATHGANIGHLSKDMSDKDASGKQGEIPPPPGTSSLASVDLQRCQEAAQLLKWQQSYLQNMLGVNLGGNPPGAIWPGLITPENLNNTDVMHPSTKQTSASHVLQNRAGPEIQHSNLTVANLLKHNSLINQKEKACNHETSVSDASNGSQHQGTDKDALKSSHLIKTASRVGGLRKLPPLDLRAIKRAPKILTQSSSAVIKEGKRSPDLSIISATESSSSSLRPSISSLLNSYNPLPASDLATDSQISAPSFANFQASTSSAFSARQPNASTVSLVSKSKKYLTPLQRKRLKMKGDSAVDVESQNSMSLCPVEETDGRKANLVKESSDALAHETVVENPSKRRKSPLPYEFTSSSSGAHANSNCSFNPQAYPFSQTRSTSHLGDLKSPINQFNSKAFGFSAAIPTTFSFPSFSTRSHSEAASSAASAITPRFPGEPSLPFNMSKLTSMFSNMNLPPSDALDSAKSSLAPGNQTIHSTQPAKTDYSNYQMPSSGADPQFYGKKKSTDFSDLSEVSQSSYEHVIKGRAHFSQSNQRANVLPSSAIGHSLLTKGPSKDIVGFDSPQELTDKAFISVKSADENDNVTFSSNLREQSHMLDDLESIDNDDEEGGRISACINGSENASSNDKIIDWFSASSQCSTEDLFTNCGKENPLSPSNLAEQFSPSAGDRSTTVDDETTANLDFNALIQKKLESLPLSARGRGGGGYGLDDISLTDSNKKALPAASESESAEKTTKKPEKVDDGWQKVGKPKKSSKKSTKDDADTTILKFRTQEKYTNLVKLILDEYSQLERDEAKEVLETVFVSTNQLSGLRQGQILAEVDLVVTEWYPDRSSKKILPKEGVNNSKHPSNTTGDNGSATVMKTETGLRKHEIERSCSEVGITGAEVLAETSEQDQVKDATCTSSSETSGASSIHQQQTGSVEDEWEMQ
ncbi:hypothetical protein ElyMa_006113900 [Elysia marginata]|uniref:Uncharacterized protein n=1 Tax=Elysia marginata TaxID=1093978 RepID=A0AAV4GU00_9GAST|nr:hypothetical protein ElyMa_006113900 [Elysia marginata]